MAKKDTHLRQTGAEVQYLLDTAQQTSSGITFPENPKEGDIFIVPTHDVEVPITTETRSQNIPLPALGVKWQLSAEGSSLYSENIFTVIEQLAGMAGISRFPERQVGGSSPYRLNGSVSIDSRATRVSVSWTAAYDECVQYLTLYATVSGGTYEFKDGAWIERGAIYVKPSTGIPASDLADGVIPDLSPYSEVYHSKLSDVSNPKEGDICITPPYEEIELTPNQERSIDIIPTNGESLYWEMPDEYSDTGSTFMFTLKRKGGTYTDFFGYGILNTQTISGKYYTNGTARLSDVEGATYFTLTWPASSDQYFDDLHIYNIVPEVAYEYVNGAWARRGTVEITYATESDIRALFATPSEGNIIEGHAIILDTDNEVVNHTMIFNDATTISNNTINLY